MLSMLVMSAKKAKIISEGLPPAFRAKFYSIHLESRFQQPRVSLDMYANLVLNILCHSARMTKKMRFNLYKKLVGLHLGHFFHKPIWSQTQDFGI
jgi:hypothetical protein